MGREVLLSPVLVDSCPQENWHSHQREGDQGMNTDGDNYPSLEQVKAHGEELGGREAYIATTHAVAILQTNYFMYQGCQTGIYL